MRLPHEAALVGLGSELVRDSSGRVVDIFVLSLASSSARPLPPAVAAELARQREAGFAGKASLN